MSYCRWSSDDFQCDLYVYESVGGGFVTNVAGTRVVFKEPLPEKVPFDLHHMEAWMERHQKIMAIIDSSESVPIGLPYDGKNFIDSDASACANRVELLRNVGYLVPLSAIDALREEAEEESCE